MGRLTTNKDVQEMGMYELAHNCCYVKDGLARYRNFDMDIDAREFARKLYLAYVGDELPEDEEAFDECMIDNLMFDAEADIEGLIALFYHNLWAMADLREKLKQYEDIIPKPKKLIEIDKWYSELCKENGQLKRELAEYKRLEDEGQYFKFPCRIGDVIYVICECEMIPAQLDGTLYDENGGLGTATGYYCPYEDNCPHDCMECDGVFECEKYKHKSAVFKDTVQSIWVDELGVHVTTENCCVNSELGRAIFLKESEAQEALKKMEEQDGEN